MVKIYVSYHLNIFLAKSTTFSGKFLNFQFFQRPCHQMVGPLPSPRPYLSNLASDNPVENFNPDLSCFLATAGCRHL